MKKASRVGKIACRVIDSVGTARALFCPRVNTASAPLPTLPTIRPLNKETT